MQDNGGEIELGDEVFELFKVLDRTDRTRLARTSARDIVRENTSAREWPGFPDNVLAIGDNGSGDVLVVATDSSGREAVFLWDHETPKLIALGSVDLLA